MNFLQKKLIFNPVLAAPWKPQTKNCENPNISSGSLGDKKKRRKVNEAILQLRKRNIESLITRFPGLKKYEARAALTMSNNKLQKAIILLEVSNCYRKEMVKKKLDLAYIKNIHVNVYYDYEKQDPALRNVVFRSFFTSENQSSDSTTETQNSSNDSDVEICKEKRVGVIITKTRTGYKAIPFGKRNSHQ